MTRHVVIALSMLALSSMFCGAEEKREKTSFHGKIILFGRKSIDGNPLPGPPVLVSMNPDGSGLQTILEIKEGEGVFDFRVATGGQRLAFVRKPSEELWILEADGNQFRVADEGIPRAWSGDGKRLVCYAGDFVIGRHFIVEVDEKKDQKKAQNLAVPKTDIVDDWSADGEHLLVTALNPDERFEHPTKGSYPLREIYLLGLDGAKRQNLRANPRHDEINACISPNGKQVAFQRRRHEDGKVLHFLAVQDRDGKDSREVVQFENLKGDYFLFKPNGRTCWSPDGKHIVVLIVKQRWEPTGRGDGEKSPRYSSELVFVSPDTGVERRLDLREKGLEIATDLDWR